MSEDDDHEEEPRRRHLLPSPSRPRPPRRSRSDLQSIDFPDVPLLSLRSIYRCGEDRDCSINFSPTCNLTLELHVEPFARQGGRRLLNRLLLRRRREESERSIDLEEVT